MYEDLEKGNEQNHPIFVLDESIKKTLEDLRWDHTVWVHTIKPTIIPKELFSAEDKKLSNGIGKTLHNTQKLKKLEQSQPDSSYMYYWQK